MSKKRHKKCALCTARKGVNVLNNIATSTLQVNYTEKTLLIQYLERDFLKNRTRGVSETLFENDTLLANEARKLVKEVYQLKKESNIKLSEKYKELALNDNYDYYMSKADRLRNCSTALEFARVDNKTQLVHTNNCHVRLCNICQYKRSVSVFRNTRKMYNHIITHTAYSKFLFITLTIKNVKAENLNEALDTLNYAVRKMRQYKKIKTVALGMLRTIEVTYNKRENTYHPHIHMLLHTSRNLYAGRNYITQNELAKIWTSCIKSDYKAIVHIQTFKHNSAKEFAEIAKYSVKASDYINASNDVLATLDSCLHKRRLISCSGTFRAAQKALKIADMEERTEYKQKLDDIACERELYIWNFSKNAYEREQTALERVSNILKATILS